MSRPYATENEVDGMKRSWYASNNPNTSSELYSLIERREWVAAALRCQTHPEEAQLKEQDTSGNTILHWACRNHFPPEYRRNKAEAPPAVLFVVEAILHACHELVMIPMAEEALPLHMACCYNASSDIVRALVQAYPPAAGITLTIKIRSYAHYAPLHFLCDDGGKTDSIRALLEVQGGALSTRFKDRYGQNPMERLSLSGFNKEISSLVDELRQVDQQDVLDMRYNDRWHEQSKTIGFLRKRIRGTEFWKKVELLAVAEYNQVLIPPGQQLRMHQSTTTAVHIFLELQFCPIVVFEIALFFEPKALMQKDEIGDIPLHIAARRSYDELIQKILRAQPLAAAIPDASGVLPLQIYIRRRHVTSWSPLLKELIVAFPSAVRNLNLDLRLYPLLWSRLNSAGDRKGLTAFFLSVQSCVDAFVKCT